MDVVLDRLALHLRAAAHSYGIDLVLRVPARQDAGSPPAMAQGEPAARQSVPRPWERVSRQAAPHTDAAAPQPKLQPAASAPQPKPAAWVSEDPLLRLRAQVLACQKCKLCESRKTVVFGEGNRQPEVLFVGEAPGAVEDQTGRPFVGPAGQLLDRILEGAMGYRREDVYIANINKCRPPGNRDPEPDEVAACLPHLKVQIALLRPKVIVALGRVAAHNLLGSDEPMRSLRGRELRYEGIPLVVTWHPAFLLREPSRKAETWQDIRRVNRLLGRPEDPRQSQRVAP